MTTKDKLALTNGHPPRRLRGQGGENMIEMPLYAVWLVGILGVLLGIVVTDVFKRK